MDALRVKHVVNEVTVELARQLALPNNAAALSMQGAAALARQEPPLDTAQFVADFGRMVASLLIYGLPVYNSLNLSTANYGTLRTNTDFIDHAVHSAADAFFDGIRKTKVPGGQVNLNSSALSAFIANRWNDYEVYFRDHPQKVAAYAARYTSINAIVNAKADVEAMGEPYEVTPFPLANGRIGCGYCNKTMADMEVLTSHHEAIHQSQGKAACTECTWTGDDRPGVLAFHQQTMHDIYQAGHPNAFSTSINHLFTKPKQLLKRILVDDRVALAELRGQVPPPPRIPARMTARDVANAIIRVRTEIKTIPGWRALVDRKRAKLVARE